MKQIEYSVYVLGTTHTGWIVIDKDATKEEIEQAIMNDAVEDIWFEEIE